MPKTPSYIELDQTDNWNVARDYVSLMIMEPLNQLKEYAKICWFGCIDISEEFMITEDNKNQAKLKAIKRYAHTLSQLIDDTTFALKSKDLDDVKPLKENLLIIMEIIPHLFEDTFSARSKKKSVLIDEEKFEIVLTTLIKIKTEYLKPLNRNNMIFKSIEEWDPDLLKKKIMEDMIHGG